MDAIDRDAMKRLPSHLWFVTGSQHLYGPEVLAQVNRHSRELCASLAEACPVPLVAKPVMTDAEAIRRLCQEANADPTCAGLILWMHTFSPAKMWIGGLSQLAKPILHLHTQFNRELPWDRIDMDFMNLNQAAHGDREAGHLHARLGLARAIAVGHWQEESVRRRIDGWARVARAWNEIRTARICRFGDNMRQVSVTEGDKVAAAIKFGFSVDGYGVGDLASRSLDVSDAEVASLAAEYLDCYDSAPELRPGGDRHASLRDAARQEIAIRGFLTEGGFSGFTTTFEDLHGLDQLPGLACQRLMADGYGFGAEGDWKTAALLCWMKAVAEGRRGGTSFMEDYTYHLASGRERVLGAHMLEICPSIAAGRPRLEVHPLGIGGKSDPVRLVFDAPPGRAVNVSLVDLGHRFRLIASEVEAVEVPAMPNLPVARALWEVKPDFGTGVEAWIRAGGSHHTVFSYAVDTRDLRDLAEIAGVELVVIDEHTRLRGLENELRWNEVAYRA
jgi:L-arabinose isomerase